MAETQLYSTAADFLLGDIPLPRYIDKEKFLRDAADEIDSHLGFIYSTPINMDDSGGVSRPARLLLKRISAHLSSGRLIMAIDSSGQNEELHTYGIYLVREATSALAAIEKGTITLDGATPLPGQEVEVSRPLISNLDAESNVEAFYNRFTSPTYPVGF